MAAVATTRVVHHGAPDWWWLAMAIFTARGPAQKTIYCALDLFCRLLVFSLIMLTLQN
jgi:hypothetical protein